MELGNTGRGFSIAKFKDRSGLKCRLQKSSLATEDCIWLGVAEDKISRLLPNKGWEDVELDGEVLIHNCMELTQEHVRELLPYLIKLAETGDLY